MKTGTHILVALFVGLGGSPVSAQRYFLRGGVVLQAEEVTVGPDHLAREVVFPDGSSYVKRYPFADVARLDFPEPVTLGEARTLLENGRAAEALALLEPLHRQFAPFPNTPGSPWPRVARLRLRALLAGDDATAIAAAARGLIQADLDPDTTGAAKLAFAELDLRAGRAAVAELMLAELGTSVPPAVEARAWVMRGRLALERREYDKALECYLRVPAFFGGLDEVMPAALLGAARAHRARGDAARAKPYAIELADSYPDAPEAALARAEFGL